MKRILFIILLFTLGESTFAQADSSKKLPPLQMLPKVGEVKRIYELPAKHEYKIYDQNGKIVKEGKAEFIDITSYKKGTYFIQYNGKKETFYKE